MMVAQAGAIFVSHKIIKHKNTILARLHAVKKAASSAELSTGMKLPEGQEWHFFLSHCQGTGGDQVYSLYLDLEMKGRPNEMLGSER
jgi:hypothetical protein